ncbi:receptor-type tyrosine-protein phosphatase eta-like [Rana temporaria]|uniref:receptor-type tyrosine-protein phosphatase eta-like n=1 Tax=Rana temporaria TaxID=8407 RepID=UPI001AAC5549|nr:receptor-type tyrosine-protein phosphatase eta-like [Rana temporaria]
MHGSEVILAAANHSVKSPGTQMKHRGRCQPSQRCAVAAAGSLFQDPTPPGNITFSTIGTNTTTLSWVEPVNMTKSYNIMFYWNASSPITVPSNSLNTTLLSLKSGSYYTVTVVTVGVRGYQSTPVSRYVFTRPLPLKLPQYYNVTSTSVSLNWSRPDEYQSSYTYRVQTNVTSSSSLINNMIVINESATIVNLTPGQTYTFLIYTRAADNSTESDPVSLTTCTVPGQAGGVTVNNYQSVNSLVVNWTAPTGIVSNYNVTITGDVNRTLQNTSTQVTFTNLLPGRNYTVTVQTISGSCNSPITTVTEATYPTPPGNITFITIGTNTTTLSWVEPVNMTGVTKSYNITYYWNASSSITVTTNSPNTTLQSLKSGSNYTVTVVTVGVRGYQSTPVSRYVFTRPLPLKLPQYYNVTSTSVSLNWNRPDEYQSSYTYRVQTNVTSSSSLINNMIVINESATIVNLTPGQTYTFLIYTRAADNSTESDPVSLTTCTVPGQAGGVTVNNYQSVNSLVVNWTAPTGIASNYNVTITGDVNRTLQNTSTQVTFTNLLPGRNYTVTVQTISGSCNSPITTVTEATYPTPLGYVTFNTISANSITLSWAQPVNMTNLVMSYNITYGNASSSPIIGAQTSNTNNTTLQSLTSGTNYTISVMTVGVRGYQSTPVTGSVYTKPWPVSNLNFVNVTSDTVILSWSKPLEYQNTYRYRVLTIVTSSSTLISNITMYNESATVSNLTSGETYTFFVYVRAADNVTESDPVNRTICLGE